MKRLSIPVSALILAAVSVTLDAAPLNDLCLSGTAVLSSIETVPARAGNEGGNSRHDLELAHTELLDAQQ